MDSEVKNTFLVVPIAYVFMSEHLARLTSISSEFWRTYLIAQAKQEFDAMDPKELVDFLRKHYPLEETDGREQESAD